MASTTATGKGTRRGSVTVLGMLPDDDAIYSRGLTISTGRAAPKGDAEDVPVLTKPDETAKDSDPK